MARRAAAAPRGSDRGPSRRRRALDLVTGTVLVVAVTAAAVLPETPGPAGRAAWAEATGPFLWVLLALWACGSVLRHAPTQPWRPRVEAALLAGAGLVWPAVLAYPAGRSWSEAVGPVEGVAVAASVAAGTVAGGLLLRARPGRSMPAYVLGRVVASPAAGPLLTAGSASIPVYFGSHLMMLGLLTRGEPGWAYRLGEWAEPFALGHNRAAVVLIVAGFWVAVVVLVHSGRRDLAR